MTECPEMECTRLVGCRLLMLISPSFRGVAVGSLSALCRSSIGCFSLAAAGRAKVEVEDDSVVGRVGRLLLMTAPFGLIILQWLVSDFSVLRGVIDAAKAPFLQNGHTHCHTNVPETQQDSDQMMNHH